MKEMPGETTWGQHTRCCKDLGHWGSFVAAFVARLGSGIDAETGGSSIEPD